MEYKTHILDGAMGTMIQSKGLVVGEIPELLSIKNPKIIEQIHEEYLQNGAEFIYTNTFGANSYKLKDSGYTPTNVIKKSVLLAKNVAKKYDAKVCLDIGPIGTMLEPSGTLSFEEAYDIFKEMIIAGKESGADVIAFETMTDLYEAKAAILAAKENCDLPIFLTMTFEEDMRTFLGTSLAEMVALAEGLSIDAVGINCSLGPREIKPMAKELCELTNLPVIIKPNAGLPIPETNEYDITTDEFAETMLDIFEYGVNFLGGCCGTTPEYISKLKNILKDKTTPKRYIKQNSVVTSSTKTILIDGVKIIGERINPTGKKLLKEALKNKNYEYIINQGLEQISAGASILDVNIGIPEIDEETLMPEIIKKIQSVIDTPLQIDSSNSKAIEAGLRVYNGKAIVNSVNGEDEVLDKILPIVKKYGASVVGLTLDENGIPLYSQDRFKIAKKILDRALSYGIKKEDVYIDCLTLTASTQQEEVIETLITLKRVKEELGLKTVLGVSNISFGLPNRELLNHSFLTMAMTYGLDLPIINPNIKSMTDAIYAFNVLTNYDKNSVIYIENQSNQEKKETSSNKEIKLLEIEDAILKGLKEESKEATIILLKTHSELDIVDNFLIKSLDVVGQKFETGKIFLPQLLLSAQAAQGAFDIIKESIINKGESTISKGKIILATVKGDVHDIGKNIVKVILQNYGYEIIDLGKDVSQEKILEVAKNDNIKLIGLSALMTTTLKNMELTINLLRENNLDCKIMVGGAVLTENYAKKIGADYYAKDAKSAVDIAKLIFE